MLGFLENSKVYFPSLFKDCLGLSSILMILGSVFLDVVVIWQLGFGQNASEIMA